MPTKIRELPLSEQPAHKAEYLGVQSLSSIELLALLAGNRTMEHGAEILAAAGGITGIDTLSIEDLSCIDGVGKNNAIKLKAALELGRRASGTPTWKTDRPQVRSPADAADLVADLAYEDQEQMVVLVLGTKNHLICRDDVYRGTVNTTNVRVSEVLREAIRRQGPAVILAHNHPSGDPAASPEDVIVTKQVVQAGELLDIQVLDHIIIGNQGRWLSMKERGLGF